MAFHNYDSYTQGAQDVNWTVKETPLVLGNTSGVQQSPFGNFTLDASAPVYETHNIKGKLLTVEHTADLYAIESSADPKIFEEKIKLELCHKIAEEMYNSGMIQWMKQADHTGSYMKYRGYVYVTSSDDVQVIRKVLK